MLFLKKKKDSSLMFLLNETFIQAKNNDNNYFFYIIKDNEKEIAQKWCNQNNIFMEIDHQTDGNIFYKFKF